MAISLLLSACAAEAVQRGGGETPHGVEMAGPMAPLGLLSTGSLSEHITDPMVAVRQHRGTATHFRPVAVVYALDGLLLCALRLDRTRPPETELAVFDGRLRPGRHLISARLTLEQFADDRLSGEPIGRTQLDGQQEFVLSEGQFAVITAFTRETAAAPTLEFEVRYRSSRTE